MKETGALFGDGSHIIYVNGSYKNDNNPIGKLMHDFRCTNVVDMFYPILAKQVKYFKETEGGKKVMGSTFRELAIEVGKEIAPQLAQEMAQEMAEKIAQEMAEKIAQEKAQKMAQGMAQEKAEKMAQEKGQVKTKESILNEQVKLIKNLMETMKMTAEQAMEAMKISEAERKLLLPKL